MKKSKSIRELLDIIIKIICPFIIVFIIYFISTKLNDYTFSYFVFPFVSCIVVFICGINVGKSLERIKNNEPIGMFTKNKTLNENITEFKINESITVKTDKKIIKQLENGERVHIKAKNYDDIGE